MKKIVSLICLLSILSAATACGGNNKDITSSSSNSSDKSSTSSAASSTLSSSSSESTPSVVSSTSTVPSSITSVASEKPVVTSSATSNSAGVTSSAKNSGTVSAAVSSVAASEVTTQQFVVPEGYTLARIGMKLEELGYCTVDQWIQTTQTMDVSNYPLAASIPANANRCFRLEGYLFPATYTLQSTYTPEDILKLMLNHTEKIITADLRSQIAASGMTVDEAITLASIIEKEAYGSSIMPKISSVFHNRISAGQRLESDVTIIYVEGAIKPFITGDVNRYNSYYNTYKCKGLPAGAICNPGITSIKAAVNPEITNYYFFVTDANKNYYFSETYEQHVATCQEIGVNDTYED